MKYKYELYKSLAGSMQFTLKETASQHIKFTLSDTEICIPTLGETNLI